MLVVNPQGMVLAINRNSRKHPQYKADWGLPGGRIDDGETAKEAAIRELFEETGVVALPRDVVSLNEDLDTETFWLKVEYTGEIRDSEEGDVFWIIPLELCKSVHTFGSLNRDSYQKYIKSMLQ